MTILINHFVRSTYINVSSNHPLSIVKQIPNAINIRINRLSSSKNIFNNHKEFYNEAIHNSDYKNELKYLEANRHHNVRGNNIGSNRTNNNINMDNKINKNTNKIDVEILSDLTLLFANSNINIGKYFLGLIKKHFKDDNPFRKIIDKNNIKISYSCTNNISKIIDCHNKKLINKLDWNNNNNLKYSCNYKIKK